VALPDTISWIVEPEQTRVRRPRRKQGFADADRYIGARLRLCRTTKGLSLQQLSTMVGITYQQAHKYELAHSRLPAGMLAAFAAALGVPPGWFFEGLGPDDGTGFSNQQRLHLELSRSFAGIGNDKVVAAFVHMARVLAEETAGHPDSPCDPQPPRE
jgi:transcriptional regulator with XRE-family HTH domain